MKQLPLISLVLLLGMALLVTACGPTSQPVVQAADTGEETAIPVEVATVETGDIALIYTYTGDLQSQRSVSVMPGAAGRVETVLVEVGNEVKAGDPIAIVESDVYAAQLKQAETALALARLNLAKMEQGPRPEEVAAAQAAVELARAAAEDVTTISDDERTAAAAALAQTEAALRLAQFEYDKISWADQAAQTPQALQLQQATIAYETALAAYNLQTNPGAAQLAPVLGQLAQAELLAALTLRPFRELDFEMARLNIQQAEVAVEMAHLQLDEATIRTPVDGVLAEVYVQEGSSVGPQAPVALVVSNEEEVLVEIEASRIGQIYEGQNAALQLSAYPGQDFPAVVTSVAPVADADTHTFVVKVTPIDQEDLLRSGMFADVSILVDERMSTSLAPRAAVTMIGDQEIVYVVQGDRVEGRNVTTGLFDSDRVQILSGIKAGETVVIAGQLNLIDGARVTITNGL